MMTEEQLRVRIAETEADRNRMTTELVRLRERMASIERELIACQGVLAGLRDVLGEEDGDENG